MASRSVCLNELGCSLLTTISEGSGATSNWQIAQPQAVWMSHGVGSKVYDVDGTEYVDMHGGYGASIAGHAHPAIVEAVSRQVRRGTHFAQPTEDEIEFWTEVFETHRSVMGTSSKPKSRNQIVKWLKNPHSDSAEYKMWGNGVALPNVYFVLSGIVYYAQFSEG